MLLCQGGLGIPSCEFRVVWTALCCWNCLSFFFSEAVSGRRGLVFSALAGCEWNIFGFLCKRRRSLMGWVGPCSLLEQLSSEALKWPMF